jgi:hypothetical protein
MAPQNKKYHVFEELDVLSGVMELGNPSCWSRKALENFTLF